MRILKNIARLGMAVAVSTPIAAPNMRAPATATPARINIQGYIWNDGNKNARIDTGEARIRSKKVTLLNRKGQVIKTVATGSTGLYRFSNVTPGEYTVRIALESWTGTSLVGSIKSLNSAKGDRSFRATFKATTTVNFGVYKTKVANRPIAPVAPTSWNASERDAFNFMNSVRIKVKEPSFDAGSEFRALLIEDTETWSRTGAVSAEAFFACQNKYRFKCMSAGNFDLENLSIFFLREFQDFSTSIGNTSYNVEIAVRGAGDKEVMHYLFYPKQ